MTQEPSSRILSAGHVIAIAGAILVAIGTLLPWRNGVNGFNTSGISVGFDADIFLLLAILTVVASGVSVLRGRISEGVEELIGKYIGSGSGLAALGGGYIACFSLLNIKDTPVADTTGIGLYLDVAGAVLMIAGGAIGLLRGGRQ